MGEGARGRGGVEHPGSRPRRLAYTEDTQWRNRDEFLSGREEVHGFLVRKWEKELDYVLRKDLWTCAGNRIAVRFQHEWHDAAGGWWRSYGNENWEFEDNGLMRRREASINDVSIAETDRRIDGPRAEGARRRHPAALTMT